MVYGINKKIRVIWLCHFRNKQILTILGVKKGKAEYCPWITQLVYLFEPLCDTVELHIISPCEFLRKDKSFKENGINYYFLNIGIPLWGRHWPNFFKIDFWSNFILNRYRITKLVHSINPDIIHLHGIELPEYSSSAIDLEKKFPLLATIQGFVSNSSNKSNYQIKRRIYFEKKILKEIMHFGIRAQFMSSYIRTFNTKACIHWHNYPINKPGVFSNEKKYDCVYFARISKDKGIEDLLRAIQIIKEKKRKISVLIIGACNLVYRKYLDDLTRKLNISENIFWAGFLSTQEEVYKLASQAVISVLPTYHDIIPGTVIESMFMKIPVVSYNVGGLPDLNIGEERIKLVERENISLLANVIHDLLNDEEKRNKLTENAYSFALKTFNNSLIPASLLSIYNEIINSYRIL
jgi:glycosyltransferase involved in cell wall biosynthesis